MRTICYNQQQLDILTADLYNKFAEYGSIAVDYDKPYKAKSRQQLGFFFGCIVSAIKEYYKQLGDDMDELNIRENLYNACSLLEPSLKRKIRRFNGTEVEVPLRLSEMDIEQASKFIDGCIRLIDNAKCFSGLVLHPSVRNLWVRHIKAEDLRQSNFLEHKFPKRDVEYLFYLRKQSCLVCGVQNMSHAHHVRIDNCGGTAIKPPDYMCISLCYNCHRMVHTKGNEWLFNNLNYILKYIDLRSFLIFQYNRWRNKL